MINSVTQDEELESNGFRRASLKLNVKGAHQNLTRTEELITAKHSQIMKGKLFANGGFGGVDVLLKLEFSEKFNETVSLWSLEPSKDSSTETQHIARIRAYR